MLSNYFLENEFAFWASATFFDVAGCDGLKQH